MKEKIVAGENMRIIVEKDNGNWAIYEEHRYDPIYLGKQKETTLKVAQSIHKILQYDVVIID